MIDLNALIAKALRVPISEISESTTMMSHYAWDSLSHMEIITTIEKEFSIVLTGDDIIEMTSMHNIKKIILQKLEKSIEA